MVDVHSTAIAAVGHDAGSCTLWVRFRSGETYAYLQAPRRLYDAFLGAPSKGRFFRAEVAPAFRYVRL